jgi:hypothetical protein
MPTDAAEGRTEGGVVDGDDRLKPGGTVLTEVQLFRITQVHAHSHNNHSSCFRRYFEAECR